MMFERSHLAPGLALLLLGAAVPACGSSPLVIPQPPQDLTATAQVYETPTGTIDPAHLDQLIADAQAQAASMDLDWLPTFIIDALTRVRARLDDAGLPLDPAITHKKNRPVLEAVAVVQHTCSGWPGVTAPAADSGQNDIDLTAVVQNTELQRAIWGSATSCHAVVQPTAGVSVNGFIDGTVSLLAQGPLPATDAAAQVLVAVSGQIGTENNIATASFDFRIVGTQVEFRHPVADGDVIVSVGPQGFSVRGSNGSYACDTVTLVCSPTS
jgi:hypothetical protein